MVNTIVQTNVTQTVAPTPSALQKTGALISVGGTKLAPGTYSLLTSASSLTSLLAPAMTLDTLTQSGGVATATVNSTTIVSGTYNSTTGLVTLTLTATLDALPGSAVVISSATGTGSFAQIDGLWQAAAGSTGTTLTFYVATGLTMTITGGDAAVSLGLITGRQFWTTIAGATPTGYNGTVLATVASATTFTYEVSSTLTTPATGTITATPSNVVELQSMATTFFAQGAQQSVYVLELGPNDSADAVTYLGTWIGLQPTQFFYSYLVPRDWANEAGFLTLIASYETTTAKTYFFVTMTTGNYTSFTTLMKCVVGMVEAPGISSSEFSLAAVFYVTLNYAPSASNMLTPLPFSFLFGVTAYPLANNATILAALKATFVNVVATGAEGGISNTILKWGTTMDGKQYNYWYAVDWAQISGSQSVAAAVINGSNTPTAPIVYNQSGINALQAVLASTMSTGVNASVLLGQVVEVELDPTVFSANVNAGVYAGLTAVNAVPFVTYNQQNPNDYAAGRYSGFAVALTPQLGFTQIIINIDVVSFA